MVIVPALLMVSTIRFRSFKTFDLQARRSYSVLLLVALGVAVLAAQPEYLLVVLAYTYLLSAFVGTGVGASAQALGGGPGCCRHRTGIHTGRRFHAAVVIAQAGSRNARHAAFRPARRRAVSPRRSCHDRVRSPR